MEVGREQPFKPRRVSPAFQAQRLTLGGHGFVDLLVSKGLIGRLVHVMMVAPDRRRLVTRR